ncbi:NAD-dependent DNA ligase LigA [Patescibacteria group bacterium]|nr:NAD-dependent DNA ligase LigA [Patescibacteria group bacterium]MCG2702687.1 NAD-dependent DNA ligase LigA [Candidatus Parcubacteria bacterium]MBU4265302.1 NAD-dependent DNA ligase LigA [Patescibacteria group bacterium]MBU4389987.1 NAD-dependent DNA ligase LigA [Patescibacteria group bacterium]MBU4397341.1 NAD-dependent DNA ligase LigA [Patescibacteria group bacterium]
MKKQITLKDIDLKKTSLPQLGELLIKAKKAYYTTSNPIMSDHTYDTLEDILRQKAPHHRIFSTIGNPNFDTGWPKKKHIMNMGSQNKASTYSSMVHYFKLKKTPPNTDFIVQPKCDGISLEIIYQNGKIFNAITRGDGQIGDLITQNVIKMKNLKKKLNHNFNGSIRCEIMVTYKDFKKINKIAKQHNAIYSNPRNAASGISQRLDSQFSPYCSLFAVDLSRHPEPAEGPQIKFKKESDKINFLKKLDIVTVDSFHCKDFKQIKKIYQNFLIKRQQYPFDIDGLVIKINNIKLQKKLGSHNNHPKHQIAYKFPAATDQSQILSVKWQIGPMGKITPVAKIKPVEISGAIINYISLANHRLIKEKNINIGDIAKISRRGDVIPHLESIITKVNKGHLKIPTHCPSCKSKLLTEDKNSFCTNLNSCKAQILGSLNLFCKNLDIKGISKKTIKKLYLNKIIKLPGDFYKIKISDIKNIEGLGKLSASNMIHQIQKKRKLSLVQVLHASIIPSFSLARIKQIISAGFNTPQKILNIKISQLKKLPGVKITLAKKIFSGIQKRKKFIKSILKEILIENCKLRSEAKSPEGRKIRNSALQGLSFCITGKLNRPRIEIKDLIEQNGGKMTSSVSKNLSYLISSSPTSASNKFQTAHKLKIPIINEDSLYKLIKSVTI